MNTHPEAYARDSDRTSGMTRRERICLAIASDRIMTIGDVIRAAQVTAADMHDAICAGILAHGPITLTFSEGECWLTAKGAAILGALASAEELSG